MTRSFPQRAIHLDFHTMPGIYDVGAEFNAVEFAQTLKQSGVDYVTAFARCNLGFAYYPTKIGIVHPGLQKKDILGPMVQECHQQGIGVSAYFNAGLDHEHALLHRDWCKVNKQGQVAEMNKMGHFFRRMCLNTEYGDHLLSMVEEVMELYPFDGIFLDSFNLAACYGVECLDGMSEQGMDVFDERQAAEHYWRVAQNFARETERLVREKNEDAYIYFNGLPYAEQPTHVELEILPTGGWGYDAFPMAVRYARTLNKPYFTMTGRFHKSWGDFCGLRPKHSLMFDLFNSIANGGTCSVGDHMHPRGRLEKAVYDLIEEVYASVRQIEPFTKEAVAVTEMAILEPEITKYPSLLQSDFSSVTGAARMLIELKCQFDVVDGTGDISKYSILVLPDSVCVDDALKNKLQEHLKNGGSIISSAYAGLEPGKKRFALDQYDISFDGPEEHNYSFFQVCKEFSKGLPDMLTTIYQPGIEMKAGREAKTLARLFKPYFNLGSWNGRHENLYIPPEKDTGRAALVQSGNIFHFSFPVFKGYFDDAVVAYKTLVKNCLHRVQYRPLVQCKNLPSFAQVTVTQNKKCMMVHVLSYLPELRGKMQVIEEPVVLKDVCVGLRTDGQEVERVFLAPSGKQIPFTVEDHYVSVKLPEVNGYQMAVFAMR